MSTSFFSQFDQSFCLRLTQTLLHFVWQGFLIGGIAFLLARSCRTAAGRIRYGIHAFALVFMVLCFPITFLLVPAIVVPEDRQSTDHASARQAIGIEAREDFERSPKPNLPEMETNELRPSEAPASESAERVDTTSMQARSVAAQNLAAKNLASDSRTVRSFVGFNALTLLNLVSPYAVVGYLLGVLAMVVRLCAALYGGHRLRQIAQPVNDPRLLHQICTHAVRIGLKTVPAVACCQRIAVPVVSGILRPVILLPIWLATEMDPEQVLVILAHEMAHIRRFDLLANLLQRLLETVLFFHPAVWYVSRQLSVERENCCDDVVVAAGYGNLHYASSLLRLAELSAKNSRLDARGVAMLAADGASGSQLKRRILRLLEGQNRFRFTRVDSLTLVLIAGLALVFTVGYWNSAISAPPKVAAVKSDDESKSPETKPTKQADGTDHPEKPTDAAPLHGRLIDDVGKPVTDARLTLRLDKRGVRQEAMTTDVDETGNYSFDEIPEKGDYSLQITSTRWLGSLDYGDRTRLVLSPDTATRHDVTLQRACRMIVRTVDEETGLPVKNVQLYVALMSTNQNGYRPTVITDAEGTVTLALPKAPGGKYIVAAVHENYAFDHLTQALEDPDLVPRRTFSLKKGKTIVGHAVCNDGKPPAGWQVYVLPTWWQFGVYLRSFPIDEEGGFRLEHIAPEKSDVMIAIPLGAQREGGDMTTMPHVLSNTDLTEIEEPIQVKMDYPSPSSLVYISGKLDIQGDLPAGENIILGAQSNTLRYSYNSYIPVGKTDFRIGPLPKGSYSLSFFSSNIESVTLKNISAPSNDLKVQARPRTKSQIRGVVLNDMTGKPLDHFHVRVKQVGYKGGVVYYLDPNWREVSNNNGEFSIELRSPGDYEVSALAEGFGIVTSEAISSTQPDKVVTLRLKPGITLNGLVVDESGKPISGATVTSLTLLPKEQRGFSAQVKNSFGSVGTINGRFSFPNLTEGKESLRVTHPDFCFLEVAGIDVKAGLGKELKFTLSHGATVTGRVYNEQGEPVGNTPIVFHDGSGYEFQQNSTSRFASVVTDRDGFYKAQHLPSQRVVASRDSNLVSLGLTRRTIVIQNGKSTTLDFGGTSQLTGRIHVNGQPLANTRIQLGSGTSGVGIMHQYAKTDDDGRFALHGTAPGAWTLSYQMPLPSYGWVQLQDVEVPANGSGDLGLIELRSGKVTVITSELPAEQLDNLYVALTRFELGSASYENVGLQLKRESANDPFVFDMVPRGEYVLTAYFKNGQRMQRASVTEQNMNPTVTLKFPVGTASIDGVFDQGVVESEQRRTVTVCSVDGTWKSSLQLNNDGTFQIDNLPAGTYEFRKGLVQPFTVLATATISDDEKKSIHLTADSIKKDDHVGHLTIRTYTSDGVPTPCSLRVEGEKGPLKPVARYTETTTFAGAPGMYRLTATLSGFKPVTQTIQVSPSNQKQTEIKVELERLAE